MSTRFFSILKIKLINARLTSIFVRKLRKLMSSHFKPSQCSYARYRKASKFSRSSSESLFRNPSTTQSIHSQITSAAALLLVLDLFSRLKWLLVGCWVILMVEGVTELPQNKERRRLFTFILLAFLLKIIRKTLKIFLTLFTSLSNRRCRSTVLLVSRKCSEGMNNFNSIKVIASLHSYVVLA